MTAYVARERAAPGRDRGRAAVRRRSPAESLLGLEAGERIEVRDLLLGLLLVSGNDAANALAQAAAGSEEEFVAEMNDAAARLGLDDTSYANPIGLDEAGNYSSARDLVDLAIELREDALFREIFDTAADHDRDRRPPAQPGQPQQPGADRSLRQRRQDRLHDRRRQRARRLRRAGRGRARLGGARRAERGASATRRRWRCSTTASRSITGARPVREGEPVDRVAIADRDVEVVLAPRPDIRVTVRRGQEVETRIEAPAEVEGPVERASGWARSWSASTARRRAEAALVATASGRFRAACSSATTRRSRGRGSSPGRSRSAASRCSSSARVALWDRRR